MTLAVVRDLWTSGTHQVTCATGTRSSSDAPPITCHAIVVWEGSASLDLQGPQARTNRLSDPNSPSALPGQVAAGGNPTSLRDSCPSMRDACEAAQPELYQWPTSVHKDDRMAQSEKVSIGEHCEILYLDADGSPLMVQHKPTWTDSLLLNCLKFRKLRRFLSPNVAIGFRSFEPCHALRKPFAVATRRKVEHLQPKWRFDQGSYSSPWYSMIRVLDGWGLCTKMRNFDKLWKCPRRLIGIEWKIWLFIIIYHRLEFLLAHQPWDFPTKTWRGLVTRPSSWGAAAVPGSHTGADLPIFSLWDPSFCYEKVVNRCSGSTDQSSCEQMVSTCWLLDKKWFEG